MRSRDVLVRSDEDFIKILREIKAQRIIKGESPSFRRLTRDMTKCPSFEKVVKELKSLEKGFRK